MGNSDGAWGELAAVDDELAAQFDAYDPLPEGGSNAALDAFLERKHLSVGALVRVGARMADDFVLAFAFPDGIKFRNIITDARWATLGASWRQLKIVRAGRERSSTCIVAEGETDGARLVMLYPEADIAVLPAGADPRPHTDAYAKQLSAYELVLVATDPDAAGDKGYALLTEHLTTKFARWSAPGGDDWCAVPHGTEVPTLPRPEDVDVPVTERLLVNARDLLAVEPPEIVSYFDQAMLPVGGQAILHGAMKSFKTYLALDWGAALAQSQPWCGFEPTDEPVKVAVMQFEIPWAYYRQRVGQLRAAAAEPELFDENFLTWTPFTRPRFVAGNTTAEDAVLRALEAAAINVLVFDPIRRGVGTAKMNDEDGVRPILHFFERAQDLGITVITTHHDNKDAMRSRGGDPIGMTGSGAFGGDADTIVSVALPKGHDLTSNERNLHFLLRNAPSPSPRSMQMAENGAISYHQHPVGEVDGEVTPGSDEPSI